jgi:molecular chaperone DnaK (HSP70)
MAYDLGVDLGTTFVAAAVSKASQVEMVTLGDRSVVTPSVVYLREDGTVVTGEAAARRAAAGPERVAREFKRRIGDPTPIRLGGTAYPATQLLSLLLRDVLAKVTETEGGPPERVVLTHPANWGEFRRDLFAEVPRSLELTNTHTITEPEAAAAYYAASRRLGAGEIVAVYDLGGGTFDATVVRKLADGVETLGIPEGVERLGGIDFDQALFEFVDFASDGALSGLNAQDPQVALALARVRQDCVLAKEALSADTETLLPVFVPGKHFEVPITREDFEKLVRAQIESTMTSLSRALRSAQVTADELNAVLLVGGSSRIPLVAQMVSAELNRPILVDTHPKYAVALGAATMASLFDVVSVQASAVPSARSSPERTSPERTSPASGIPAPATTAQSKLTVALIVLVAAIVLTLVVIYVTHLL